MRKFLPLSLFFLLIFQGCMPQIHLDILGTEKLKEVVLVKSKAREKILMVDVEGIISTTTAQGVFEREGDILSRVYTRLEKAADDENVKGLILRLNTPGGEVTASDIIYNEILKFKEKTGIPILGLMMGLAASGGYYVASACDYIIAHPSTLTGSIGVISVFPNLEELFGKIGVKVSIVKSGRMKDSGSVFREMTEEEKRIFQNIIEDYYKKFIDRVYDSRKKYISMDKLKEIADGRIFTASQALELKLIDEVGYFDSALEKVLDMARLKEAKVIAYTYYPKRKTNIYASAASVIPLYEKKGISYEKLFPYLKSGFYYLWLPELEE